MLSFIPLSARYMVLSAIGFSMMGVFVKLAGARGIPVLEIVAARALVSMVLSYVDIKRKNIDVWGHRKGLLLARGFVGALALICVYYSLLNLPFAEATVLQYLHPMFTAILALFFLGERIHWATSLCIALSLVGLIVVVQPEILWGNQSTHYPLFAISAAILGAVGSAVAYVIVRKLSATEDSSVVIFYFPIIALPLSIILLGSDFVMPQGWEWGMLLMVGVGTQLGQVGLTKAMQTESAGKATGFSYLQVVFAIVFGMVFFNEIPTVWVLLGASFIIAGAFINVLGSANLSNKEKS